MALKILIADDKDSTRQLLVIMLQQSGADLVIHEAIDGRQAVNMAKQVRPDLLIIDHQMPELNGYEAVKEIRADTSLKGLPIIMVTGKNFDQGMKDLIKMDVNEFVAKPFHVDQIMAAIEKALGKPLVN